MRREITTELPSLRRALRMLNETLITTGMCLNKNKNINMSRAKASGVSGKEMYSFYDNRLKIYEKIGLGNLTEFGTVITQKLLDATKKRRDSFLAKKKGSPLY